MRIIRFIVIPLIAILIVLGACAAPTTTPSATTPPTTTPPATTPPATTPPTTAPPTTTPPATTPPATTPPATTPPVNPTGPAAFVTSNLEISPNRVEVEDVTTVSVKVTNTGGQAGTYTVVMKVNGEGKPEITSTKGVTLNGGESKAVQFPLSSKILGDFVVTIDKLTAKFSVEIF